MTKLRRWLKRPASGAPGGTSSPRPGHDAGFYACYQAHMPRREQQTVVILADDRAGSAVADFLHHPSARRIVVISPEGRDEWGLEDVGAEHQPAVTLDEVNWLLRFLGPVDMVVDTARRSSDEYDGVWRRLFLHLRPRGLYVIDRRGSTDGMVPHSIADMATTIGATVSEMADRSVPDRQRRLALHAVSIDTDHILVTKRGRHVLKVRDELASRLLPAREPDLQLVELATLPGGTLTAAARVHSHGASVPIEFLDTEMDYPAHHLRHYRGQVAMVANALLHTEFTALPDSFRHHRSASPGNPRLVNVSSDFARVRPRERPTRYLAGDYYHLDSENSGHYGHLMTEVLSRLWGWDRAKKELPELKAIFRIRHANERVPTLERRLFGAYGIDPADITWVHEPVWLESVVGATPMWHNQVPHYVHPEMMEVWDRVRASLLAEAQAPTVGFDRSRGDKIFVSRRDITTNRACRNTREVEAFFEARGFDVVYPEIHDLSVQAAIFDRARVVAGFGGSAMFNIAFSRHYETLILLNHEAYTARNEHLYTALLGGDVHYFWSTPDIAHPVGGWSEEAYYSSWAFDLERNAAALSELLTAL